MACQLAASLGHLHTTKISLQTHCHDDVEITRSFVSVHVARGNASLAGGRQLNRFRQNYSVSRHGHGRKLTPAMATLEKEASRHVVEAGASQDELFSCMAANAEASLYVISGTELVKEAQRRHVTAPTATAALGRLLLGTLLLGALKGGEETVQVMFSGRGPIGHMTAVSSGGSMVKGYVANPLCDPPLTPAGKMDVGAAVGPGLLTVVRSHPSWPSPYTGTVPLQSGEVAEDLASYLADSEQIFSALSLGVSIGRDGKVRAAGGFLLQVLPGCSDETLAVLETNVQSMPPMSDLAGRESPLAIAERLLNGLGVNQQAQPVVPSFGSCFVEELAPRMLRAVELLGSEDVRSLLQEQGHVEVRCEFCAEVVRFQEKDLQPLLEKSTASTSNTVSGTD